MNLLEYMKQCEEDEEITVFDKDYDIELYFYGKGDNDEVREAEEWEKAYDKIAECLEVVEELTDRDSPTVAVNLLEVIERSLKSGAMDDLFIFKNIDAVMGEMDLIFAGNVSEEWFVNFADAICRTESMRQEKEGRTAEALEM